MILSYYGWRTCISKIPLKDVNKIKASIYPLKGKYKWEKKNSDKSRKCHMAETKNCKYMSIWIGEVKYSHCVRVCVFLIKWIYIIK